VNVSLLKSGLPKIAAISGVNRLATVAVTSFLGYQGDPRALWYVMTAARRLDTAHRQLERVREAPMVRRRSDHPCSHPISIEHSSLWGMASSP
jgi:hypothetical protein